MSAGIDVGTASFAHRPGGGPTQGQCGAASGYDVGPTSERDVCPMSLPDVGPTPRHIGPTSARRRADEQTTQYRGQFPLT